MKNKKGFTLIELLAIIVILAIIAVITVPIILNIIKNARMGTAKDSAYGYKDAVNKYFVSELFDNKNLKLDGDYIIENGKLKGANLSNLGVEIPADGTIPTSGKLTYENSVFKSGCLVMGDYAVTFNSDGSVSALKGECSLNSVTIVYGYKTYGDTDVNESVPADKFAYFKYVLTNGEVASETIPEVCINSDTYGGELCLKNNEFETSIQKIKDFFGYSTIGENAWTNIGADGYSDGSNIWKKNDNKTRCRVKETYFSCMYDGTIEVETFSNGRVLSHQYGYHLNPYYTNELFYDVKPDGTVDMSVN